MKIIYLEINSQRIDFQYIGQYFDFSSHPSNMKKHALLPIAFLFICLLACQPKTNTYFLGQVNLDVSGSDSAKEYFMQGLLLLHSFEYKDALTAFLNAQKEDPECIMAFWGEAMAYNHPIWQEQDYQKGQAALEKIGSNPEHRITKAKTDLEKDFLTSLEILYGEGNKVERDKKYADYFFSLYQKYPKNHEVAVFYGLSLLGSIPYISDMEVYQKAADILEKVMMENPDHPGAVHYFIHANDEPNYAPRAKKAADLYARVAPDAAHALHMPSHIYLSMGMWENVVESNEVSFQASVDRRKIKNLDSNALGFHSFQWLQYGYLQQERFEEAEKLLIDMIGFNSESSSTSSRVHQIYMRTTYLIETENWDSEYARLETDLKGINIVEKNRDRFVHAFKAYLDGDYEKVRNYLAEMQTDREAAAKTISLDAGMALCGTGGVSRENATPQGLKTAQVFEMELEGLLAKAAGDLANAEKWFKSAVDLENEVGPAAGPPIIVKPSHEILAEFLMEQGRNSEAIHYFDQALLFAPNRTKSVKGKKDAEGLVKQNSLTGMNTAGVSNAPENF